MHFHKFQFSPGYDKYAIVYDFNTYTLKNSSEIKLATSFCVDLF